jgi:pimeloyl-ACP methyl ester carboxylesterase
MSALYKSEEGARAVAARYREILSHWPVANEQLHVPTSQGDAFVIASGAKDAPPLILLHGSAANSAMWMRDVLQWSTQFRVYAIDMIGEPGLSAPVRPSLKSGAYAPWLGEVIAGLGLDRDRMSLVGISLGGWLALSWATQNPACVEKLVLLCPGGVGRQKMSFMFKALPLLLLGKWGRKKAMALAAGPSRGDAALANPAYVEFQSLIFRHFRTRKEPLPVFDDASLKRLAMPVMLIAGGRDALLDSYDTKRRLEALLPRLTVLFLPDEGHFLTGHGSAIFDYLRAP